MNTIQKVTVREAVVGLSLNRAMRDAEARQLPTATGEIFYGPYGNPLSPFKAWAIAIRVQADEDQ